MLGKIIGLLSHIIWSMILCICEAGMDRISAALRTPQFSSKNASRNSRKALRACSSEISLRFSNLVISVSTFLNMVVTTLELGGVLPFFQFAIVLCEHFVRVEIFLWL